MKRSLPLIPLVFTLVGVLILCLLGTWQVHRLTWKNDLQAKLDRAYMDSRRLPSLSLGDIQGKDFTFKRGVLNGRYIRDKIIFVQPRTYDGKVGQHMYAAFRIDGGGIVFVNRGWVPPDFSFMGDDGRRMKREKLIGLFKKPPRPNIFTPANDPQKNQWYHPLLSDMADSLDLPADETIVTSLFILEEDGSPSLYPSKSAIQIKLRNQHMQYAVFWFMMAGTLIVIFALRFLRKTQKQ